MREQARRQFHWRLAFFCLPSPDGARPAAFTAAWKPFRTSHEADAPSTTLLCRSRPWHRYGTEWKANCASSIITFWRRWHITLSFWLRDYLYIPLGGNRRGRFGEVRNILITMALGDLLGILRSRKRLDDPAASFG